MKSWNLLVAVSLALNAALAIVYVSRPSPDVASTSSSSNSVNAGSSAAAANGTSSSSSPKSKPASAAGKATWASLNPRDLRALAARLKAAGFSPAMVRAIVGAQISESFKARREQLLPKIEDRPFWQTDSNGRSALTAALTDPKYRAAQRELSLEMTRVLKEVLGDEANARTAEADENYVRRFGNLPKEKLEQLQRLDQDYNDLRSDVTRVAQRIPLPEDREKLVILEREKMADLAQLLTPQEIEEYLMRTSQTTSRMRQTLTAFNATEDEFKALYRVQAAYDEKYNNGLRTPLTSIEQRNEQQAAQAQLDEQYRAALGDARYADFARAMDREHQQLSAMTKQAGVPDSAAIAVTDMRVKTLNEANRIIDEGSMSADEKRAAIQALAQTARSQTLATLGQDVGTKYLQVAERWLTPLERGSAVKITYTLNGSSMSTRNVPASRPAAVQGSLQIAPTPR